MGARRNEPESVGGSRQCGADEPGVRRNRSGRTRALDSGRPPAGADATPDAQTYLVPHRPRRLIFDFGPFAIEDDELKKALSGLTSIVDGLGAFRTHAGSAHGYGQKTYRPPRQARLVASAQRPQPLLQ